MIDSPVTTKLYDRLQSEVHVWFCLPLLIQDESKLSEYKSVLSIQEMERYHRFHFENDKHSYLVSHALLRHSLSKYADVPASDWQFSDNEHGKPELMSSVVPDICFNLTHTDGLSACVIALNRNCGIDAENINRRNKLEAVAQRMFAEEELVLLDDKNIKQHFYHLWTLREAYVKALGTGLAGSSKEFYFDVDKNDLSVVMHHKNKQDVDDKNWHFRLYEPTLEHVLAVGFESFDDAQVFMAELIP
jgi:4'-phosphopantetheinyl transferase